MAEQITMPKPKRRRGRKRVALVERFANIATVMDYVYNRGMTQAETAKQMGMSLSQIERYVSTIDHTFIQQITDATYKALAQHIARLQAMQQDAYENMVNAKSDGHRIQWYRARLETLRDIAKIMGFEKASASMVFEQGDERYVITAGGVDDLVKLKNSMADMPNEAYEHAYTETREAVGEAENN